MPAILFVPVMFPAILFVPVMFLVLWGILGWWIPGIKDGGGADGPRE